MARARARSGGQVFLVALVLLHAACAATPAAAMRTSAISAAPESPHPRQPGGRHAAAALPPALSPDIMPMLPSPSAGADAAPPSDVVPTIPSSLSPPNPDALEPDSALAPFGSAPAIAAQSAAPPPPARVAWALAVGLLAMWLV
ncbi:hypothetical protein GUJ93_ZPchr0007g6249 [Zizania palustris]|uniref:Uncharacterized protein n=1 Tax=Zizania palustris TaxID=103762 RepID=A0A8J5W5Y7_ZIZPA|nr:hypothetical protein GUJ93_ZPchr0007g6249 [Zizania palustris]